MKRILLFVMTNLAVVAVLGVVASLLGPVSDVSDAEVPARGCESSDCAVNAAHGSTSTPLTCGARDR